MSETNDRGAGLAAIGGLLGGLAALSCCVVPLLLVLAGISGVWIGNLTALSPYQPIAIAAALGFIAYGHVAARRARRACTLEGQCARPLPRRWVDAGLWTGTAFVAVAAAITYVGPYVLP